MYVLNAGSVESLLGPYRARILLPRTLSPNLNGTLVTDDMIIPRSMWNVDNLMRRISSSMYLSSYESGAC